MKIKKYFAAIAGLAAFASASAEAALITYNFVPSASGVSTPGIIFTAQASFEDSSVNKSWITGKPLEFTASMTRLSDGKVRTWDLGEIGYSVFEITKAGVLTFSALTASDLGDFNGNYFPNYLTGGPTGFSSPYNVQGLWQQGAAAPPAENVPDGGPGALAAVVVVGMGIVARRQQRKRLAA